VAAIGMWRRLVCASAQLRVIVSEPREMTFTQLFGAYFYYSEEKVRRVTG
jgi:hypothetical protein